MSSMEFSDGNVSKDQEELLRSNSKSANPLPVSISPKSPRWQSKREKESPRKLDQHSHAIKDGSPIKGKL